MKEIILKRKAEFEQELIKAQNKYIENKRDTDKLSSIHTLVMKLAYKLKFIDVLLYIMEVDEVDFKKYYEENLIYYQRRPMFISDTDYILWLETQKELIEDFKFLKDE